MRRASGTIRATCYAAVQHFNKSSNILDREGIRLGKDKPRGLNVGFAPIFESVSPTAVEVTEVVFEILTPKGVAENPSHAQRRE